LTHCRSLLCRQVNSATIGKTLTTLEPNPLYDTKEDFPVKNIRILAVIVAACTVCSLLLCTIKDDNGSLAPTGPATTNTTGLLVPFLMVVPDSQYIGVRDTLGIAVTVLTDSIHDIPIAGAMVTCAQSAGWLAAETLYSDAKGRAVFRLMDTTQIQVNLTITCGLSTQNLSVQVTNTPDKIQKQFVIVPTRAVLKADGNDTTTINVTIKDQNNNPVSGQCVQFISSAGLIMSATGGCSGTGQAATNSHGVAQAILTSANINDTAYVTAYLVSDKTKNAQTKVVFSGVSLLLHADTANLKPLGQAVVTAVLTNGSNQPIPYSPIYFALGKDTSSNLQIISKDTMTGPQGNAQCIVRGKRTGTDSVRVTAAGALSSIKINVTDLSLSISLDATVLQAQATLSTLLHAQFSSNTGTPLAGKTVQVQRSYKQAGGGDTSDYIFATTDSAGKCAVTIYALPYEGVMTLQVTAYNSTTDMASATTSISFLTTRVMTINAVPPIIQADGTSQSLITMQVKNTNNNPMVGDSILFSTDAGMVTALGITDANGRATANLTSDRRNTIATVKGTLQQDITKFLTVAVKFTGVQIAASANPPSINSSGKDSTTISITLLDGANNPIVGEPINFSKLQDSTFIFKPDSVTDNRGTAICKVYGKGSGTDTVKILAAGATASVPIYYSANYLAIDTAMYQPCIANGKDSTMMRISYFSSDRITPVPNAVINVSLSLGTITPDTAFAHQFTLTPANNGVLYFYVKNPNFANTSTIFVYAKTPTEVTASSFQLYFQATRVRKITLTATPSVIATNGSKSVLTAIAFDSLGNRVSGEQLTFNMFSGPGSGEYLNPTMVITAQDGSATSSLLSGTTPSNFKGVGIVASDIAGIKSDSVFVTIAGPPVAISIVANILTGTNYGDGTFGLPCAAIVTDVNGNPVADGSEVTFSLQVSGYIYSKLVGNFPVNSVNGICTPQIDTVSCLLPFLDFSNTCSGNIALPRGEDLNDDCIYDPGPPYIDINHDGRREFDWHNPVEPVSDCGSGGAARFADFNNDGEWDPIEPLTDITYLSTYDTLKGDGAYWNLSNKMPIPAADSVRLQVLAAMDSAYVNNPHFIKALGSYDFSWSGQPYGQPSAAVTINRTVQTAGGKAANMIVYGQTNANEVQITAWAECQGVVCQNPLQLVLPVIASSK